jgi:hypothetical protein
VVAGPDRRRRQPELFRLVRDGRLELNAEVPESVLAAGARRACPRR